ncbi:MAG TPA: hypothetical protein VIL46_15110 [Gemmataceae bacterium]
MSAAHPPPLADVSAAVENLARLGINILTVIAAFILGMLLTHVAVWAFGKYVLRWQPPRTAKFVLRVTGGAALAILVALFIFGTGGFGVGWGESTLPGPEGGEPTPAKAELVPEPKQKEPEEKQKEPREPAAERVEVTILGGYDEGQRYYRLAGDERPITFSELTQALQRRMNEPGAGLKAVEILVYRDSAARSTAVVQRLEQWARAAGLGVYYPPVQDRPVPE